MMNQNKRLGSQSNTVDQGMEKSAGVAQMMGDDYTISNELERQWEELFKMADSAREKKGFFDNLSRDESWLNDRHYIRYIDKSTSDKLWGISP